MAGRGGAVGFTGAPAEEFLERFKFVVTLAWHIPIARWQKTPYFLVAMSTESASAENLMRGPLAKLARANEHIEAFTIDFLEWAEENPFTVTIEPFEGGHSVSVHQSASPPLRLAIIVGEALHQLRSALDHAANALDTRAGLDGVGEQKAEFPIFLERAKFDAKISQLAAKDISVRSCYLQLQPFADEGLQDATEHPLWRLFVADNAIKHRYELTLSYGIRVYDDTFITLLKPEGGQTFRLGEPFGVILGSWDPGAEGLARIKNAIEVVLRLRLERNAPPLDSTLLQEIFLHVRDTCFPALTDLLLELHARD